MSIYQLIGIVFACLMIFIVTKSFNERFSIFISIAGSIVILFYVCTKLTSAFTFVRHLAENSGINNQYFDVIMKGLTVCYLAEITIGFCKDCGQNGWCDKIEMACRGTLLVLAIPLFEEFLNVIMDMFK